MKKALLIGILSFGIFACSDSGSSSGPENDPAAPLFGTWETSAAFEYPVVGSLSFDMEVQLQSDKSLRLNVESNMGSGTAAGTWTYQNDTLRIVPTNCPAELTLACALFGEDTPLPVNNLTENSWSTEYPWGSESLALEFVRSAD